jgi:hypothetical protein
MKLTTSLLAAAFAFSATLAGYGIVESKQSRLASPAPAATSPATPPSVAPAAGDREVPITHKNDYQPLIEGTPITSPDCLPELTAEQVATNEEIERLYNEDSVDEWNTYHPSELNEYGSEAEARASGKPTLLHFTMAENCAACVIAERQLDDPAVLEAARESAYVVMCQCDSSLWPRMAAYKVRTYPEEVIVSSDGKRMLRHGPFATAKDFADWIVKSLDEVEQKSVVTKRQPLKKIAEALR